ncbi:uncharacterized protein LOC127377742 isoform X2 [Dicentrarchus labrax]|uniref:uncharacterized protein LOC127377742 isoform X2 n=1 Tax=Dicentrarchus labrax TaxID=13489 RepID=UPI0021F535D8|nr:uncharacterized protein LOC127377742 isoform X2 [Dicentrarchus labrax]
MRLTSFQCWPEADMSSDFGDGEINKLISHLQPLLLSAGVDVELIPDQWTILKTELYTAGFSQGTFEKTWPTVNRMLRHRCPDVLDLFDALLTIPATTAERLKDSDGPFIKVWLQLWMKCKLLEVEMLKKDPDHQLVEDLMVATFSQRRDEPFITEIISRWPALFHDRQIRAEFKRIVTTDLLQSFLDGLDGLVPRLLEVYKAGTKSGKKQSLKEILNCLEKDDTNERRRTAAWLGLPHYISGEDPSDVIRMCDDMERVPVKNVADETYVMWWYAVRAPRLFDKFGGTTTTIREMETSLSNHSNRIT